MSRPIVVVGAGGHGREVLDVIAACNAVEDDAGYKLLGVVDDAPEQINLRRLDERGITFLGDLSSWLQHADRGVRYVIGIGSMLSRRAVDRRMTAAGFEPATLIHPSAVLGSAVRLSPGVVVCPGVILTTNITVGRHTHLNFGAAVGHDTRIGNYVMVNPSANISGDCAIEDDVMLGVGCVVLQGLTVGRGAMVGASACVVRDVPAEQVAKGVPARWEGAGRVLALPDQRADSAVSRRATTGSS